jgi:prevent-host-death family protein
MYACGVDVAISELRANLRSYLDHARKGEDIVVTERGVPIARLVAVDAATVLERLERDGIISRPKTGNRPRSTGRTRVKATAPVSELVAALRR